MDCGYSLEPPHWGSSNEDTQSMFWAEIEKYLIFLSQNFHFLVVKFSLYLNRHAFVMFSNKLGCSNTEGKYSISGLSAFAC